MNYLAHLYLAQPHADSYFGNLLGDFRRGEDIRDYSLAVQAGLQNHYLVDKFTDSHQEVRSAKRLFSPSRRRFAGIALDVLFDYFLIQRWQRYSDQTFSDFCLQAYRLLDSRLHQMPLRMQKVVGSMIEHQWLDTYRSLDGVALALDRIASRIRFENGFAGSIQEVHTHFAVFERTFEQFFPDLLAHVAVHSPEQKS